MLHKQWRTQKIFPRGRQIEKKNFQKKSSLKLKNNFFPQGERPFIKLMYSLNSPLSRPLSITGMRPKFEIKMFI